MATKVEVFKVEDNILEKVAKEFNKEKDDFEKDITALKEWLESQPHLPKLLDSGSLLNFLLLNKGSVERAKQKIDNYYTIRSNLTEIFEEINPKFPYCGEFEDIMYAVAHPQLNENMHRIFFFKVKNPDLADKFQPVNFAKYLTILQEMRLREDAMYGDIFVVDWEGISLSMVLKYTPSIIHKSIVLVYKEIYSLRIKGVYFVNFPSYAESLLLLFKSVMSPKIKDRFHFCKDLDSLKEMFPSKILPKEFGGEGPSLEDLQKSLKVKRLELQKLFDRLDEAKVDEELRPEKLKNDDFLGFYGNFKKLNLD